MQDTTNSIFRSAARFFSGTMLSRVAGMFRDIAMAFAFGTQDSVAAFLVAFRWSHLLRRLLGEGALQAAFIPQFEKLRSESTERACRLFCDLCVLLTLILTVIVVVSMAGLWGFLNYGNLSPGNQEIVFLTLLMMPGLLFICLYGLNASLLQCERQYFISSAAPIAFNLIWILGVACIWKMSGPSAMPWLAGFIVIACMGEWLITVPSMLKILKRYQLSRLWQGISFYSKDISGLLGPLFLGMIGVGAAQVNNAMDTVFARYADAEGPAYLWYSIRLQQLPLALFGIAISGALLPPLSRAIKGNDLPRYRHFLAMALRRAMALMVPITFGLLVMGDSCINLLYGHGDFNADSTIGTTKCLWAYALGLIPMTLVLIMAPAFYAQGNYRTPTNASLLSMGLNISLNAVMVMGFGLGAASVALATSISAWANFAILANGLKNNLGDFVSRHLSISIVKMVTAGAFACISVIAIEALFFNGSNAWKILNGAPPEFLRQFTAQVSLFGLQSLIFLGTIALAAIALKADDMIQLVYRSKAKEAL